MWMPVSDSLKLKDRESIGNVASYEVVLFCEVLVIADPGGANKE